MIGVLRTCHAYGKQAAPKLIRFGLQQARCGKWKLMQNAAGAQIPGKKCQIMTNQAQNHLILLNLMGAACKCGKQKMITNQLRQGSRCDLRKLWFWACG